MHLMVESAVILSVLGDIDHAFIAAIKRSVKNALLFRRAAFDLDLAEHFIPTVPGGGFDFVKIPRREFPPANFSSPGRG